MEPTAARETLHVAYGSLTRLIGSLDAGDFSRRTRCSGWCVRDLVFHLLLDTQRALIAFTTETDAQPDTNAAEYWQKSFEGAGQAEAHARFVRVGAAAFASPSGLAGLYRLTSEAVLRASDRADPSRSVDTTQGHIMTLPDFLVTLTVEAALHHLDLIVDLPDAAGPDPRPLATIRGIFDSLLGGLPPERWDDVTYALKGSGRVPLDAGERGELGALGNRFPLL